MTTGKHILLDLLASEGVDTNFGNPGPTQFPPIDPVTALPRFAQRGWSQPVRALGQRLLGQRDAAQLEDRLRRSGWRYGSVGDYYGSKIATAVTFFVAGAMCGLLLGLSASVITVIAGAVGLWGLFLPDLELRATVRERREALYREMAWTLDRVALVMRTGEALEPALQRVAGEPFAWLSGGSGGLFTALLRDIATRRRRRFRDATTATGIRRRRFPSSRRRWASPSPGRGGS